MEGSLSPPQDASHFPTLDLKLYPLQRPCPTHPSAQNQQDELVHGNLCAYRDRRAVLENWGLGDLLDHR